MLNRLFELLGMSDDYDDEIVVTSHKEGESKTGESLQDLSQSERMQRVMSPLPTKAEVVLCRGGACAELKDELISAVRQGRLVLVDLQGVDLDEGNAFLSGLHEVTAASHGALLRVSRTAFLATPVKTACEEWVIGDLPDSQEVPGV
ncbi:MAG: hypothetical protein CSA35_04440 [Dethiosulfovibrio peptidovorans]|nr:MAG: hypothetical protein CSA35_04440 [Dethiosulfovibrio peptidovorans]